MNERILFAFTKANGHVQTKPEFSPSTLAAPTTSGCDSPSCTAKSMQKKRDIFFTCRGRLAGRWRHVRSHALITNIN